MRNQGILLNGASLWNSKRRYAVNSVVLRNGSFWQNTTGSNSTPGVGDDWEIVPGNIIPKSKRLQYDGAKDKAALAALVNATTQFTVKMGELFFFSTFNPSIDPSLERVFNFVIKDLGAGVYGAGGMSITAANIIILSDETESFIDSDSTQTIALGEIGTTDIWDALNSSAVVVIQDQEDGFVIVTSLVSGTAQKHFFIGAAGTYGTGGLDAVEADFFGPVADENLISGFVPYTQFIFVRKGWGNTLPVYQSGDIFEGHMSSTRTATRAVWNGIYPLEAANMEPFVENGE